MRNFLPAKMQYKFDLKGATFKRNALTNQQMHKELLAKQQCTLLESEWMDAMMEVDIDPEAREQLVSTARADVDFLASQQLMDYSLLLGIHSRARNQDNPPDFGQMGGLVSTSSSRVFFFGIVDVLESWHNGWWWQGCCMKSVFWLSCHRKLMNGITAITPERYARRFAYFVENRVLCDPLALESDMPNPQDKDWIKLWENRRNGLMMRRISDEKLEWRYIREQLLHANTAVQTLRDELDVLNPVTSAQDSPLVLAKFEKTENELASRSGSPHSDEAAAEAVDLNEDPFDAP